MTNITFNSKETYLAFRSAWKAEYKKLSAEIRTLRLADRFFQRKTFAQLALTDAEERCLAEGLRLCGPGSLSFNRLNRSKRATEMLAELKEAKLEAQRQYLARKEAEAKR
jgi:hypothetical protein